MFPVIYAGVYESKKFILFADVYKFITRSLSSSWIENVPVELWPLIGPVPFFQITGNEQILSETEKGSSRGEISGSVTLYP